METIIRYAISFCAKNEPSILSFWSNHITAEKYVRNIKRRICVCDMTLHNPHRSHFPVH